MICTSGAARNPDRLTFMPSKWRAPEGAYNAIEVPPAESVRLSLEACGTIGRQISEGTWRPVEPIVQEESARDALRAWPSISERPSRRSDVFAPTTSRIVGKMSTVSTIRSTTSPRRWPGNFIDERHLNDVGEIVLLRSRLASGAAFAVTRTMIGGDDDERLIVRPDFAQPPDQITDETVDEPDLRQMSLVERIGIGRAHSFEQTLFPVHRASGSRDHGTAVPTGRIRTAYAAASGG